MIQVVHMNILYDLNKVTESKCSHITQPYNFDSHTPTSYQNTVLAYISDESISSIPNHYPVFIYVHSKRRALISSHTVHY